MTIIVRWLGLIILLLLLAIIHIISSFFLPPPWSNLNIVVAMVVLLTFEWESSLIFWFSLFIYFLIELYSATNFGITLAAGNVSSLVIYWLYGFMFTNYSWYSAFVLGAIGVATYRLAYTVGLIFAGFFSNNNDVALSAALPAYSWELIFTSILSSMLIWSGSRMSSKLRQMQSL